MEAKDGGTPAASSTALVEITVLRNLFSPEFVNTTYETSVFETQDLGNVILKVSATDDDTKVEYFFK